jgi:hypothetical protein
MEIKTSSTKLLRSCFDVLSDFLEDSSLAISEDFLCIADQDKSRSLFIKLKLMKNAFEDYDVPEAKIIMIQLDELSKIFHQTTDNESSKISFNDGQILIEILGNTRRFFHLPLLPSKEKEILEHEFIFSTELEIPFDLFEQIINNAQTISSVIIFKLDSNEISFFGKEKNKEVKIEIPHSLEKGITLNTSEKSFETKYSIEFLAKIIRAIKVFNPFKIKIFFGADYPIKIIFSTQNDSVEFSFIMGPLVS